MTSACPWHSHEPTRMIQIQTPQNWQSEKSSLGFLLASCNNRVDSTSTWRNACASTAQPAVGRTERPPIARSDRPAHQWVQASASHQLPSNYRNQQPFDFHSPIDTTELNRPHVEEETGKEEKGILQKQGETLSPVTMTHWIRSTQLTTNKQVDNTAIRCVLNQGRDTKLATQ